MSCQNVAEEKIICQDPLETILESGILDISKSGTPRRYRLLDCSDFVEAKRVTIAEYTDFPKVPFAAISYVWRGNTPDEQFNDRTFNVPIPQAEGAEPGDPIGVEVLRESCVASIARGATHLWLDRLCIMQESKEDKRWQISKMYEIYRRCHICIVLSGGVQCMVRLDEETQWIHRGWTLQEAVAPKDVVVLFSWKLGSRKAFAGDMQGTIEEVSPSKSAVASLSLIIDACTTGSISIENGEGRLLLEVKLFSSHPADRSYQDFPFWRQTRRVLSPNVGALARIMSDDLDQDAKDYSIWQSGLMRTSSRPVDMVFSIMGLFGVALDTSQFGKQDRVKATIALVQAIMKKGGRATWLAAAFRLPPSRQISTFPRFPRTSVSGKAFVRVSKGLQEVSLMTENEYPISDALIPMPKGSVDDDGYLSFNAKAIAIRPYTLDPAPSSSNLAKPEYFQAVDKSWWTSQENTDAAGGEAFAVLIGFFVGYYPGATPADNTNNIRAAIVESHEKHAQKRFHMRSYVMIDRAAKDWVKTWPEQMFSIGGPAVDVVEDDGEELPIVSNPREQYQNNPHSNDSGVTPSLEGRVSRRARWAIPQKALEGKYGQI